LPQADGVRENNGFSIDCSRACRNRSPADRQSSLGLRSTTEPEDEQAEDDEG